MNREQLAKICRHHQALLLSLNPDGLRIALTAPPGEALMQALRFASPLPIEVEIWPQERFEKQRQRDEQSAPQPGDDIVAALDALLLQAIERRASDIHLEPGPAHCRVRLRTDGRLQCVAPLALAQAQALSARLKVLAGLDIAERRMPQDGQFTCRLAGENRSFRLSTLPCQHGETLVLRLLTSAGATLALEGLGLSADQRDCLVRTLQQPQGLILVTGPTGSGKTVTLYAALNRLNQPDINLCSVEDPVEIPLEGLNQTQINPKAGLTFQRVLRALLRQDPDVIMIGEIRDSETATIALNAAQTGHLVLSTLHTNSTAETLTRLQQMAIPPWMVAAALKLVIAQRLVRRLCPHCRQRRTTDVTLPAALWPEPLPDWRPVGCERCYSGYYGRLALFELMPIDAALREAIIAQRSASQLSEMAVQLGMPTLWHHGFSAVTEGQTTLAEIWRVVGVPHGIP